MRNFWHYKPHSSQSPVHERKLYDVFLSFRGPDVRKSLVDHLYQSLSTAGVNVFLDSEKLEKGENIGLNLEQAIQNSTIYIPIFSPDYASSAWCLKEVSLMWDIKSSAAYPILMIPLFYNVEPFEVRYVDWEGAYAEAFKKHKAKGRHRPDEIQSWKKALSAVSCLSGWSLKETFFGYEGKLVKQVVKDVLQALHIGVLDVAKRPVGLTDLCDEVIKLLKLGDESNDIRLSLGIWGMGGLGKTTLSKALYNKIHHLFQASCFLSNVKQEESIQGLRKLQQRIIRDLLKTQIKLNDIASGKAVMKDRLASVRALVVLDDVDDVRQIDTLVGDGFGEGSRVIITSRDKRVLEVRQVDVIYPMRGLELPQAVELFSWHAFLRACPKRGYIDRTKRIVKACWGLPLLLEIIGTDLYNRNDSRYWDETLHKLKNTGHDFVFETLKISYHALTPVEKHIFLDIACFFDNLKGSNLLQKGTFNMDFYCRFWSALGWESAYIALKALEEKALIVINEHRYSESVLDGDADEEDQAEQYLCEFYLHEQIKEMGRRIVREESWSDPTKRSRVWMEEDIRVLMAVADIHEKPCVEGLASRRYMEFHRIDGLGQLHKLNFLLWRKLKVKAQIERLPANLKYLVLSDCQLKDHDYQMTQVGTSRDGDKYPSVRSPVLPKSISQLIYLKHLDMCGTKQTCLPEEVCALRCLEELYLSRCNLEVLPEAFGDLINLKTLDVSHNFLSEFPSSLQCLKSLWNLDMAWNERLVVFPTFPEHLLTLSARGCSRLQEISLNNRMNYLKTMDLSHCINVTRLPLISECHSLRNLYLAGCKKLVGLDYIPHDLGCLRISGCSQLRNLSFFPESYQINGLTYDFAKKLQMENRHRLRGGAGPGAPPCPPVASSQRLFMIGCDNIPFNIFHLLDILPFLEQMEFSLSPGGQLPGEILSLVGQRNLTLQRSPNSFLALLFCFVFDSNGNARLPEMEVVMTSFGYHNDRPYSRTVKLASHMIEDGGRKYIVRVCVCNGRSIQNRNIFNGGMLNCSYNVGDRLQQDESPALLRQAEIFLVGEDATIPLSKQYFLVEEDATSQRSKQFLEQWKLLPSSNDIKIVKVEKEGYFDGFDRQREEKDSRPTKIRR